MFQLLVYDIRGYAAGIYGVMLLSVQVLSSLCPVSYLQLG